MGRVAHIYLFPRHSADVLVNVVEMASCPVIDTCMELDVLNFIQKMLGLIYHIGPTPTSLSSIPYASGWYQSDKTPSKMQLA